MINNGIPSSSVIPTLEYQDIPPKRWPRWMAASFVVSSNAMIGHESRTAKGGKHLFYWHYDTVFSLVVHRKK